MTVLRFWLFWALPGTVPGICFGYVFGMASKGVPRHPQRSPQGYQKVTQRLPKLTQRSPKYQKVSKTYPKVPPKVTEGHPKAPKTYPKVRKIPQRCPKGKEGIPKVVPPLPLQRWRRPPQDSALGSTPDIWRHVKNDDSCVF